jgi:hypothetical protein
MRKKKEQEVAALDDLIMDEQTDEVEVSESDEETESKEIKDGGDDYFNDSDSITTSTANQQLDSINTRVLSADEYNEFFRIISIFADLCTDVDIRDGIIRQKINDHVSVFEIDLTPLIGTLSIPISNLKQKLELFKCFSGHEVTINNDSSCYRFSDNFSSLVFLLPHLDLLDNKYMTEEDLSHSISALPEHLMLKTSLSKIISDRIRIVSKGFNTNSVTISLNNDKATISSSTTSKEQTAKFLSNIPTEQVVTCKTNVSTTPFIIDHDGDILLQVFENENDKVLNEFKTTISDVNISIYCRSHLMREGS